MSRIGRGTGRAGEAPMLGAIATLGDPVARHLFDGDGRPRALLDRALRLLRASPALVQLLARLPPSPVADRTTTGGAEVASMALAELLAPESRAPAWRAVEAAIARAAPPAAPLAVALAAALSAPARGSSMPTLGASARTAQISITPVIEADGRASGAILTLDPAPVSRSGEVQARRLQAIGALAGGVAHDFNNLLQAIIGAGESLADGQGMADNVREDIAVILGGARRGAAMVRQLLAFSRQQTLQPRIVAVNQAVEAIAPLLRRSLGERVRLEVALDEPGRHVAVDPGQLDQVLVNLSINARDAMPAGGTLTLRTGRRTLLAPTLCGIETIPPGRYVMIEVQDTGGGIDPAILPRIFEPFFTTRQERGSGLGLSTVLGIVRQSGGFVEVDSAPGQGSVFRVLLPRSAAPAATPAVPEAADAETAPGGVILLVEDEDVVRRLAQRALERQGWRVLSADCGEAALALLTPGVMPTCLVTDMVMPGIDGAALAREVRHRLARPTLPAIIVSGYAEVPLHDAIGATATAFLPKPYSLRDLTARVAALVGPADAGPAERERVRAAVG